MICPSARQRVLVANGAKPFLFFTILATCDPGDEVIYPDPGFPIYESAIHWVGATPVPLPLHEELRLRVRPGRARGALGSADQAGHPQLAAEPDGRGGRPRAIGRAAR